MSLSLDRPIWALSEEALQQEIAHYLDVSTSERARAALFAAITAIDAGKVAEAYRHVRDAAELLGRQAL